MCIQRNFFTQNANRSLYPRLPVTMLMHSRPSRRLSTYSLSRLSYRCPTLAKNRFLRNPKSLVRISRDGIEHQQETK